MLATVQGDPNAFAGLYRRYRAPVSAYLRQMVRSPSVTEELTQEVFLKAYRARADYSASTGRFSTWLWTIARNTGLDFLRKKSELPLGDGGMTEEENQPSLLETLEAPGESAEEALIQAADQARLDACMAELSLAQREALTLRTVSELPYSEIATTLGVSLAAVKSLLFRAKESLMRCLGGSPEGAASCP